MITQLFGLRLGNGLVKRHFQLRLMRGEGRKKGNVLSS